MPVPQHASKHRARALFRAADFHRYLARKSGRPSPTVPRTIVFVFGWRWARYLPRRFPRTRDPRTGVYRVSRNVGIFPIPGPGAPLAVMEVEELAPLGARNFVLVGWAGGIDPSLDVGSVVLCTEALRDEGASHHYVRQGSFAFPSSRLTSRLARGLRRGGLDYVQGPSWTIDAVYRETVAEIRRYRRAGILTVEMEASAVFTVAQVRHCAAAAVFVVSDRLRERGWQPAFHDSLPALRKTLGVVLSALED